MKQLSSSKLAIECNNEQTDGSHEPFCFELFRRAITEGCGQSQFYLDTKYRGLVQLWVRRYLAGMNLPPSQSVEDLVQDSWLQFWIYYTPAKLERANSLGELLSYFKLCTITVVAGWRRGYQKKMALEPLQPDQTPSESRVEETVVEKLAAEAVWKIIESHCQDELDLLLARLSLVVGLKPGQITEQYSRHFADVDEVYAIKRNLFSRLRRDEDLIRICKKWFKNHL